MTASSSARPSAGASAEAIPGPRPRPVIGNALDIGRKGALDIGRKGAVEGAIALGACQVFCVS